MPEIYWILPLLLFSISLVYVSVGLGGGSSYLALLYLFGIPLAKIPPIALSFNIIAASVALYKFSERGYFIPRLTFPFLLTSIPATFLGARWTPDEGTLSIIFAISLFSISLVLLSKREDVKPRFSLNRKTTLQVSFFLGIILGLLAGIIGIGGGIFLGPILLLIGVASAKHVAAMCSAFVLVNSVVGLISHYFQARIDFSALLFLGLPVFVGAQVGAFLGTRKFSPFLLQRIFAFLLLAVSLKLGLGILGIIR